MALGERRNVMDACHTKMKLERGSASERGVQGAVGSMRSLLGLLAIAGAVQPDGPRVVLYQDQWALYGRQFSVYDLDDTIMIRDMPYSDFFLMHAFLYADPSTCLLHTTDRWGDFGWAMFETTPGVYDNRGRTQAGYTGTRGWFGYYADLKKRYSDKNLHIMPSIGGWSLSHSLQHCTQAGAPQFLGALVEHTKYWGWDGIDIDWEYPSCDGPCGCQDEYTCSADKNGSSTNNNSSPGDWAKYAVFLSTLRKELDKLSSSTGKGHLYMSMAIGMSPHLLKGDAAPFVDPTPIEWLCSDTSVDFLNLMTYDFFGTWLRKTGPLAPLYDSTYSTDDDQLNLNDSISNVVSRCISPKKLNMGLATYSKAWRKVQKTGDVPGFFVESDETIPGVRETNAGWQVTGSLDIIDQGENAAAPKTGTLPWYELVTKWFDKCERTWAAGSEIPTLYCAQSPVISDDTQVFIAYEDPESWYYKMAYAQRAGLGGAIIWTSGDFGGTMQMDNASGKDIGKPLWRSIFQGWYRDLSINIGDAKITGSGPGASWPLLTNKDPACADDQPNCSCPLEPEPRPSRTDLYQQCQNPLGSSIDCPGCGDTATPPSGNAPTSPVLPPTDCRRPADQPAPAKLDDPLSSYTSMGCGGKSGGGGGDDSTTQPPTTATTGTTPSTGTTATTAPTTATTAPVTTPGSDSDFSDEASCVANGCSWECS
ncbi:glycoside hydrolase family 18 protein [Gregarina niphandrodes]|uniref:Glycoside hydrolase family 18 protein n=1 Tax=Gregarina niphandrodes TaxID=110365 RepID=A0A023B8I3_GRENI|nr:glycoside hydrolase family 18 protein [Gregarina niphandrodes]EZG69199.1 glycoside hydrolase family 18 protein [Gregarina niphandrodes]|eukprot:XP_011134459.1 glycoside hydrolase family 18 protein [Gregarina niphandrodes]